MAKVFDPANGAFLYDDTEVASAEKQVAEDKTNAENSSFDIFAATNEVPTPSTVEGTPTKEGTLSLEPGGSIDRTFGSYTHFGKGVSPNPGVLGNLPTKEQLLSKKGKEWGRNIKLGKEEDPTDKKANAQKIAKDEKKENNAKNINPDNPTAAAAPKSKEIHDAILEVDPSNVAGSVQKALHCMVTLKMMDKLTSPAGIAEMAAGAMGGALGNIAGALGGPDLACALLKGAMPALTGGVMNRAGISMLNGAIGGMLDGSSVGALSIDSVVGAASTAASIAAASSAIYNPNMVLTTAASIGGPTLGMDPTSLSYALALTTPGMKIKKSQIIKGIVIESTLTVLDSTIYDQLGNIPRFTGTEHVEIAQAHVAPLTAGLNSAIYSGLGATLSGGSLQDIAKFAIAGGIGGAVGSALGGAIGGVLNGGIGSIVDGGLSKVLGFGLNDLMGNVSSLLPNIAGNLVGSLNIGNAINSVLPGAIDMGAIGGLMNESTKVLGIARMADKAASIFIPNIAEEVGAVHDSMVNSIVSSALGGAVSGFTGGAINSLSMISNGVNIDVARVVAGAAAGAVAGKIVGAISRGL
jgi:hypothetical protein